MPLPDDKGRRGDGRPKVRRFRSHWLELGRRLRDFRARNGVTQTEIARAIGAGDASTVAQCDRGVNVPAGIRQEHLVELLEGQRWPELRAAALTDGGLPAAWGRGARWYRRASRERRQRKTVGAAAVTVRSGWAIGRAILAPPALLAVPATLFNVNAIRKLSGSRPPGEPVARSVSCRNSLPLRSFPE